VFPTVYVALLPGSGLIIGFKTAKLLLGLSCVCIGVPLILIVLLLPELSVPKAPALPNFKNTPLVPY